MMKPGKTMLVLSACMALQMTGFVIVLPLFARRFSELGAGVEALGMSEMAFALTGTLAAPWMGALADRFGRKPLALISLAAYAAAFCGYGLAQSVLAFILIRGLAGALTAGLVPAVFGMAADLAPSDRKAQWMGFVTGGASVGWIAGPIAGGMIFDRWGYLAALLVSICLTVITWILAWLAIPNAKCSQSPVKDAETMDLTAQDGEDSYTTSAGATASASILSGILPRSLAPFPILLVVTFAVLFAWSFIEPRFMFYAYNDLGWSSSMLGLVMSTYGIALMVGELTLGGLSDRWGRKPVLLLGLTLFSAQFFGLAFFHNYMLIAVTFVIAGLGNALYDPALNAALLDISAKEHSSRTLGIRAWLDQPERFLDRL